MTSQASNDILELLGSNDRESGFVEYLPENVQADLAEAIRNHLSEQRSKVDSAAEKGVAALPIFLKIFAGPMLK